MTAPGTVRRRGDGRGEGDKYPASLPLLSELSPSNGSARCTPGSRWSAAQQTLEHLEEIGARRRHHPSEAGLHAAA